MHSLPTSKRVSSASCWPLSAPVPLLFVAFTALPRGWRFLPCQQFLPSLSLHIQDVSFTKQEPVPPCLTPVCFHSASMRTLLPTLYVRANTIQTESRVRTPPCCSCTFVFRYIQYYLSKYMIEKCLHLEVFKWNLWLTSVTL